MIRPPLSLLFALLLGISAPWAGAVAAPNGSEAADQRILVTVAVLAHRGEDNARHQWQPTMDYLSDAIPGYRFQLDPQRLKGLKKGNEQGRFDFVLTNPGQYVEFEAQYGITRLATLINLRRGKPYTAFGSVIFARSDNPQLNTLADIRGKRFAGVKKQAFGAFQTAWYELTRIGIDPFKDTSELIFTGIPQDAVVYAVRDGKADAGTVRTDVMERMAAEGLIDLADFKLLQSRKVDGFPFWLSTDLYPEWAFARTPRTDEELARKVAIALLSLPADSPAAKAGKYAGWLVPANYNPVHELYRAIRYGPYQGYGEFSFSDVLQRYWKMLLLIALLLLLAVYHTLYSRRLNQRLSLAKQRAESASQAKGIFLANMSHEIRTPLNAVLGYAQILRRAPDMPEKFAPQLNAIDSAGNHLLRLINDILDLSRIEAGADELAAEEFPLARLVDGLSSVFEMRCRDQDLVLVVSGEPDPTVLVVGDPQKLRQVLYNLLGNAVKFTRHGEVRLKIDQQGDKCSFVVEDTGRGIPSEDLKTIFEPFKQAKEGMTQGGTGLGLDISRRYVELMGGKLQVRSVVGRGARFYFTLPLRVTNRGYDPQDAAAGIGHFELASGQSVRALVVDDVEVNRLVLAQILGDAGVEVSSAENGQQALDKIDKRQPDIVWMDLRMPVMGGTEAIKLIHQHHGDSISCVAVTSSSSTEAERNQILAQGFDAFVSKPYTIAKIFEVTEELLGVRFNHHVTETTDTDTDTAINKPGWQGLSSELRQRLTAAASEHRVTSLKQEIDQMRKGDDFERAIAAQLQPLLARFDMDGIEAFIHTASQGDSDD